MDALLAVLARDRRTRTLVAVAAGLVVASVGGVYLAARSTAPSPCRGGERRLAEVWDADVKARIAARFTAGPSYGPKTWRAVEAALDGYAAGWIDMQREACEATRVHGEQSEDMLGRRMECLEERRTALLVFGQSLLEAEPRVMDGAPQSALQLPAIDDCADRAHLAAGPPASATPRQSAAILASARLHGNEGKLEQSLDEARRAAEAARAEGDALHEAAALTQVGHTQNLLGDVNGAAETLRAAAEVAQRSGSRKAQMDVWTRQFYIYERQGQLESARDVVELAEQALRESPDRRRAAVLGYIRALLLLRSGEYPEANRAAERALALYVEAYGADAITLLHPLTLLSDILRSLGRLEESRAQAQRAVDLARGLGEDHPLLASARTYLAEVLRMMSRRKEAIGELELAAASYRRVHGENHGDLALVEMRLGLAFADEGRHAEALAHYEKARAIHEALGLDKSTNALFLRANSAVSLTALGRAAEAETIHREVLAAREKVIGPRHAEIAEHRRVLGNALARQGRLDEAWREYQSSLEVATAALGADHPDVAAVLRRMAEVERARGRFSAALALDTRAATIQEQKLAPDHDDRLEGRLFLALDHLGLASPRRALPLAEPAFAAFATRPAPALAVFARWVLGRALWESGDDRAAGLQLVQQARADITREGVRPDLAPEIDRWLSRR
jgi:tetratricopeptide (TPR) repeat protein